MQQLYIFIRPAKLAATTTTHRVKSPFTLHWLWLNTLQPIARKPAGGEGGLVKLTLPGAAGEGFKQKIIDIIDLSRLGGVVWCGEVGVL